VKKILAVIALLTVSITGYAFEIEGPSNSKLDIYASIRTYGMVQDLESETTDTTESLLGVQINSRLGFIFKKDNIIAHVEYNQPNGSSDTTYASNGLRLAYVGMTFDGDRAVYVGQQSTIAGAGPAMGRKLTGDSGIAGFGGLGGARRPGIRYDFSKNFQVLLFDTRPDSSNYSKIFTGSQYSDVNVEQKLPKFEVQYAIPALRLSLMGAYSMFSATAKDANNEEKDFDTSAYHVSFLANPSYGKFGLKLTGFYAVNGGLYAQVSTGSNSSKFVIQPNYLNAKGEVEDVKTYGGGVTFVYKVDKQSTLEVGYGFQSSSSDMYEKDDDNMGVFANYNYKLNRYVQITPEIGFYDMKENATKKGQNPTDSAAIIQAGIQFRIDL